MYTPSLFRNVLLRTSRKFELSKLPTYIISVVILTHVATQQCHLCNN
jgi:hypothetical protein